MKDYYDILKIPVTASITEIKQAYRKLVMIYHPDKNNGEIYASSRFNEIKEAYETLINPAKKEQYLQQRWLYKASGKNIGQDFITPSNILKQALELNKFISKLDVHRMNHAKIVEQIKELMNKEVMEELIAYDEKEINFSILQSLLKSMNVLPLHHIKEIAGYLSSFVKNNEAGKQMFQQILIKKQSQHRREMLLPVYVILLVIVICFLIWYSGKPSCSLHPDTNCL